MANFWAQEAVPWLLLSAERTCLPKAIHSGLGQIMPSIRTAAPGLRWMIKALEVDELSALRLEVGANEIANRI